METLLNCQKKSEGSRRCVLPLNALNCLVLGTGALIKLLSWHMDIGKAKNQVKDQIQSPLEDGISLPLSQHNHHDGLKPVPVPHDVFRVVLIGALDDGSIPPQMLLILDVQAAFRMQWEHCPCYPSF